MVNPGQGGDDQGGNTGKQNGQQITLAREGMIREGTQVKRSLGISFKWDYEHYGDK